MDHSTLTSMLLEVLYFPFELAGAFMSTLASLEAGNPAPLYDLSILTNVTFTPFATCPASAPDTPFQLGFLDTRMPIACGDSLGRAQATLQQAKEEYQVLFDEAGFIAGMWWPALPGPCTYVWGFCVCISI